ncbi:glycine cleavage system T protein [Kwoniella dejecticola CBS 10117]|uniref:Aminomethyltransferase n=1 Tax=Kwoniella dejecticola CBS 10117 TaxID=1296121 RepID=A0A1A6AGI0_9TREE|nr:glycine cleavage system T protein [Kwoniella dejecticola CBS 10117]OBR89133.1 glycine cleavage system T protein [Kwoniella dejecticola CBS 10117]
MIALRPVLRCSRGVTSAGVSRQGVLGLSRGFATSLRVSEEPLKTPLYDFHVQHKAKMVPFAGWSMPLSYGDVGQITAHKHVRASAGLFDVSHMLQHNFTGASAQDFLLSLCPSSLASLKPFTSTLSVLLNDQGGIIDDTIITKHSDEAFYVVTNAGRAKEDKEHISRELEKWNSAHPGQEVKWETLDGYGLVALQGPKSSDVLQGLIADGTDLNAVKFGQSAFVEIRDGDSKVRCHIARGGYTGEDGFEISLPPSNAVSITNALTTHPEVELIGLGARDSLRLEAGMCLYGHDLDESVSPVEAGLSWVIGKDRRAEGSEPSFPGKSRILSELASGPSRRRVGFEITGSPAREGCKVFDSTGSTQLGVITSGIPSPTTGKNIAMGYIANGSHKKGTAVMIEVRKKMREAVVTPMPFVPSKYFK